MTKADIGRKKPGENAMLEDRWTGIGIQYLELMAKALVETCVRNTQLENLHAGVVPHSETGDYSDVKVVTPSGEIPWTNLSRISDPEMKALMIEIVDRVFTFLQYPGELLELGLAAAWGRPKLDPRLMHFVERRTGSREINSDFGKH